MRGADLTKLPGLDVLAVERILSESGVDMRRWPSEKHFCAWLNVAPDNLISGGKILSANRERTATVLPRPRFLLPKAPCKQQTAIGAFIQRIKSRLGAPKATNAGAHKLARLVYRMLKFDKACVEPSKPNSKPKKSYSKIQRTHAPQPSAQSARTRLRR